MGISPAPAYAQNGDPDPIELRDSAQTLSAPQPGFMLGWNWGAGIAGLNKLMHINAIHGINPWRFFPSLHGDKLSVRHCPDTTFFFWVDPALGHKQLAPLNGIAMQYDPTLDVSAEYGFRARSGDTTGAIFGFSYRNSDIGVIENNPERENFDRFLLRKQRLNSDSALALSGLQPGDELFRLHNIVSARGSDSLKAVYSGAQLYLAINLRSLDPPDQGPANDTVLALRATYAPVDPSLPGGAIVFDSIPDTRKLLRLPRARGIALGLQPAGSDASLMYITSAMLHSDGADAPDRTISAFFRLDGQRNPQLRTEFTPAPDHIRSFDIQVYYYGSADVGIDWVRLETPAAQALLRSHKDSIIQQRLQEGVDKLGEYRAFTGKKLRIQRFYGLDEPIPALYHAMRHFNRLLQGRATTELKTNFLRNETWRYYYREYIHAVQPREFWYNHTITIPPDIAAPYIRYGHERQAKPSQRPQSPDSIAAYLNLQHGYRCLVCSATSTSQPYHYETFLIHAPPVWPLPDELYASKILNDCDCNVGGFQAYLENTLVRHFIRNSDFLFDERPWYANIWQYSEWRPNASDQRRDKANIVLGNTRPNTAEELRLKTWYPLILGAKGLFYYLDHTTPLAADGSRALDIGFFNHNDVVVDHEAGSAALRDTALGGDFLAPNDWSNMRYFLSKEASALTAKILGIGNSARLYIGRASQRLEALRINTFAARHSETLLRLRLVAWYDHGYRINTVGDIAQLRRLVRVDSGGIRVRRIGRSGAGTPRWTEPMDSAFFGITLLRDTTAAPDQSVYIGIVNRRTDPTIRYNGPGGTDLGGGVKFFSGVEFEDLVQRGAVSRFDQHGAREITVTIKRTAFVADSIRVTDLDGAIDTTLALPGSFSAPLLPGEGKLIKITPLQTQR